ncbi:hypothetical protein GCM10010458_27020 [Microbacterium luteolum]
MGANRNGWTLTVFDGEREVRSNLTYDRALPREISFTDQIRGRLIDLGYIADDFELVPDGDAYRIDNVRPLP